jgi:carboxymethylenebutenolidase
METTAEDVQIDGRTVVVARPTRTGSWPGVVMIHEAWGIDDVLRRQADKLAAAGYLVFAPDLIGEGMWLRCVVATFRAFQARSGRPFELIESCRQRLIADPMCTGKVGVIGFCMGGGFALVLAADGFHASAVNYGVTTGMKPADIDQIASKACPIVASYGGRDRMAKAVPALQAALAAHDVPHDVKVYPSAGHQFLNDAPNGPRPFRPLAKLMHAGPEPVAAADACRRNEAFFAEHLGSARPSS